MTKKPRAAKKTAPRGKGTGEKTTPATAASTAKATRKKPTSKKMGRPRIEFDLAQIEGLGAIMATDVEIAQVYGCSVSTIEKRKVSDADFLRALEKGRAAGKLSLRRTQWAVARGEEARPATASAPARAAVQPHPTMLIWLGKQWLDQRDRQDVVTINQVEEFSEAYIDAGRSLVENIAAGASPEEVLRMFETEVRSIAGLSGKGDGRLPN